MTPFADEKAYKCICMPLGNKPLQEC